MHNSLLLIKVVLENVVDTNLFSSKVNRIDPSKFPKWLLSIIKAASIIIVKEFIAT
jgi:hypothetical protein